MNLTKNKLNSSVEFKKPPLKRSSALPFKSYKRIKIGLFGGSPIWNAKSTLGAAKTKKNETKSTFKETSDLADVKQEHLNKAENRDFQIHKVTTEGTDYKNYNDKEMFNTEISLNSVASEHTFDDTSAVKDLDSSDVNEILTSSPLDISETLQEDFVLFASDVVDFVEHDSNIKNIRSSNKFGDYSIKVQKPINKLITSSTQNKKNTMINNKGNSAPSMLTVPTSTCENLDVHKAQCIRKSTEDRSDMHRDSENVELVLLPRPENKMNVDTGNHNTGTTTCVPISSNLPKHNTGPYSRIGSCLSKSMIVNRTGMNTANKSHPIVVTTKRLMSEVTQTTAKVSIGNTTISVPLLKPIISSHIISNESQKYHTVQSQMQNQQQFQHNINSQVSNTNNQPKILNVKRGNKINPPTIVSLSQLQIKPSVTGKIVQATVVGKKIQFPKITIDTPTTITSSSCAKSDVFHTLPYPKLSQLTVLQDVSLPSKILEDGSSSPKSSSPSPTEVSQKTEQPDSKVANVLKYDCSPKNMPKTKVGSLASSNNAITSQHVTAITTTNTAVKGLPQLSPFVKTELAANMPKSVSQQLKAIMNNAVKTQGQKVSLSVSTDSPQMRFKTSSPTITSVSPDMQEFRIAKTTVSVASLNAKVSSSPLLTVPKTISLMLTKNSAAAKTSNVLLTENSNQVTNKIHLSKVGSMLPSLNSKAVAVSVQLDTKSFHSPSSEKNTTNQPIKRSKSTDEFKYEVETTEIISSKKNGIEIPLSKRSHSLDNNVCSSLPLTSSSTTTSTFSHLASEIDVNDAQNLISSVSSYGPTNTSVGKNEDAQNVLLKQLLQSTNNQTQTTICNQTLPGRKVISVRAPSLGLVSSLEAQLARPVMPPVPTATSILPSPKQQPKASESVPENMESSSKNPFIEFNDKSKQSIPKISKETSFVSKPALSPSVSPSPVISLNTPMSESCITFKAYTNIMGTPTVSAVRNKVDNANIQAYSNLNICSNVNTICNGSKRNGFPEEAHTERNKIFSPSSEDSGLNNAHISSLSKLHSKDMHTLQPNLCLETSSVDNCSSDNFFCETMPSKEKCTNSQLLESKASQIDYDKSNLHDKYSEKSKVNQSASTFPSKSTLTSTVTDKTSFSNAKEVELRKKRKREYQKHRRQLINNKESCGQSKKRSRKTSKIEEDYDSFIDSLMAQIRQMSSLQVLEPLLGRSFSICSLYGARDLSKISNSKEYSDLIQNEFLQGEFGNGRRADIADFYHMKPFGSTEKTFDQDLSSIQNGFYDQEFSPVLCENESEKLRSLINVLKEKNIEMVENILIGSNANEHKSHATYTSYPGTVMINDYHSFIGRMSPIIPIIKPFPLKTNHGLSADSHLSNRFKHIYGNDFKNRRNSAVPDDGVNQRNLTVVLTLSSKSAKNILGVLCDLANILNLSTLGKYKIVNPSSNLKNMGFYKLKYKIPNNYKSNNNVTNIQKIINGTNKLCRNCDKAIIYSAIQVNSEAMVKNLTPAKLYFCSKACYAHFQFDVHSQRNLLKSSSASDNSYNMKIGADKISLLAPTTSSHNSPCRDKVVRYKHYNSKSFPPLARLKKLSEKEVADILFKMDITLAAHTCSSNGNNTIIKRIEDTRECIFCNLRGDCISDGPSRLLNFDVDKWIHLNCALWSNGVYETISGGLMNLEIALQAGLNQTCTACHQLGATIKCFKNRCGNVYHLPCAMKEKGVFYKNKTMHCSTHAMKTEKENELTTLSVQRRVFVERDESRQVAAVMHHSELSNLLRVGSLTFLNIGQLLPHQLEAFHTPNYIYPIGYKIIRFYWSMKIPNKRCRYICTIAEVGGRPEFRIQVQEPSQGEVEFRDSTPKAVWQKVLQPIAALREKNGLVQLFQKFITGEDLFGLTEPAIVRILESLPGIETLTDYRFKYGRNPLLELPLAINPSGSARSEPKQRQVVGWKKPHTQRTSSSTNQRLTSSVASLVAGEVACPYSKQFVHSKSSQYKKMKQEWRNNVYLARSKIQGLGLYAARDLEKHTMVIEYIGEVIRTEVSELREKQYEAKNRGIYMFRLDEERVVDATLSGGLARYINHSCNPNCVTEIVDVDREYRIIIFAKRRVSRGEELSYDYKFDIEDDAHKISCMCGAPNCRKWMN